MKNIVYVLCFTITLLGCGTKENDIQPFNIHLSADVASVVVQLADSTNATLVDSIAHIAERGMANDKRPYVVLFIYEYHRQYPQKEIARSFSAEYGANAPTDDRSFATWLDNRIAVKMQQAVSNIKQRLSIVNATGVEVTMDAIRGDINAKGTSNRSVSELEVLLMREGKLEFFKAVDNLVIYPVLKAINDTLVEKEPEPEPLKDGPVDTGHLFVNGKVVAGNPGSIPDGRGNEPLFRFLYPYKDYSKDTPEEGPVVGYSYRRHVKQVDSVLALAVAKALWPAFVRILPAHINSGDTIMSYYAAKISAGEQALISNKHIHDATVKTNEVTGKPSVSIGMTPEGALLWHQATAQCIGQYILLVVDGEVYSSPRVAGEITSGFTEISGTFTQQQAEDLAAVIAGGKLPVALKPASTTR